MLFATSFSKSNSNKMNQEGNSAPRSSSKSSKLKSSGSAKSSAETPAEKLKRKEKDKKQRKKEKEEKKEKEPKSDESVETTPYCSKTAKRPEQVIPVAVPYRSQTEKRPAQVISTANPVHSTHKEKSITETPAEKLKRKSEKNDKKESKKESKSKDSSETREEKAQRRKEKKDKKEKKKKEIKKEQKNLMCEIKALQARVKEVESENRHLSEENTAMQELEKHLNQAEEQLEYATEENHEFSTRVHALEQALVGQETELDNALATIQKQKKRDRKAEKTSDSVVDDAELAYHVQVEQQLAFRKELDVVQEEVELLRYERDEAMDRAITLSMETASLKAEVSESSDQVVECKVVIEQLRTLWQNSLKQQSSSSSVCSVSKKTDRWSSTSGVSKKMDRRSSTSSVSSFSGLPISIRMNTLGSLWGFGNKDDDKFVVSNYDDDCMLDQTEDSTDEGSQEDWDLEEQPSVVFC